MFLIIRKNGKKFWVGTLTNVTKSDSGNYTCLVKNHSGENGSNTIDLLVDGKLEREVINYE